jgi:hypothetical protein
MDTTIHFEFRYWTGTDWITIGGPWGRCATAEESQHLGKFYVADGAHRCQIVMVTTTSQVVMEWKKEG